ncbi:MAG: PEP-CTERM sorting domain-containing protein [Terrimicrobiaceae bacterium]
MKNTLRKTLLGLALSLFTSLAAHSAILYQQDFSSYPNVTSASTVGWSYSTTYGNDTWGIIQDQGTGSGNMLFAINGWTHALTTPFSGNETQIVVQSLIFPQVGSASAGLFSQNFSAFNGTANWAGFGPQMTFSGGNFSLQQSGNAGGASSVSVAVSGVTVQNAIFSMVIDVTTGLANGYFGSPSGTLLVSGFDLKGSQTLSQFQTDLYANGNFGVISNQGLFDDITVSAVPEPSTFAMLMLGMGSLTFAFRRRRSA